MSKLTKGYEFEPLEGESFKETKKRVYAEQAYVIDVVLPKYQRSEKLSRRDEIRMWNVLISYVGRCTKTHYGVRTHKFVQEDMYDRVYILYKLLRYMRQVSNGKQQVYHTGSRRSYTACQIDTPLHTPRYILTWFRRAFSYVEESVQSHDLDVTQLGLSYNKMRTFIRACHRKGLDPVQEHLRMYPKAKHSTIEAIRGNVEGIQFTFTEYYDNRIHHRTNGRRVRTSSTERV